MKRYLLFAGYDFYPAGGWDDFISDGNTVEELKLLGETGHDWAHIVDRDTGKKVTSLVCFQVAPRDYEKVWL